MTVLSELHAGDDPAAWVRLGFSVHNGDTVRVGPVAVRLDGRGGGLHGWTLADDGPQEAPPVAHPNGTIGLDHVVLLTDDRDRTAAELTALGGDVRRRAAPPEVPVAMAFVRFGDVIVEVAEGGGPPRLWGLVAVVEDLDGLAATLGPELLAEIKDAVQPGRRIATVRRVAGMGTALAFMTPR